MVTHQELFHRQPIPQNCDRTKWLAQNLAEGLMVDRQWLRKNSFSHEILERCQELGVLEEIVPGLFRRVRSVAEDEMGWEFPVNSMQSIMKIPVHAGGQTALECQGVIHYLRMRGPWPVHLYTYEKLPDWLIDIETDGRFIKRSGNKLFDADAPGLIEFKNEHFETAVIMSSKERAMCELMDELPKHHVFHGADMYMSHASWFCPKSVQKILEACKSYKAKRLFLFFAERQQMPWYNDLDLNKIDLGKGVRQIEKNGMYVAKYKITVPDDLDQQSGDLQYEGEQF